ncbi:hypothetical protein K450DRAFT_248945 [Umbelopsis ramanniana AG]|uniref:Peptidase M14 domain-containing protein n=1 Tax=Umbelopsis ramanniana AG TaxID=1314678 RepID=A0AAD5HBF3_UMBRA|nr:uncharacterized protein K450DRAFT_248945 [Umbelopsis ramanniana AG]KAI8578085.1 hypothetical protein K450DRAFT_248945 [Umbelopsis ramanniana AG]
MKLIPWAALLSLTTVHAASLHQQQSADYSVMQSQVPPLPTSSSDIVRYDDEKVMEACINNTVDMQNTLDWIESNGWDLWKHPSADNCLHVRLNQHDQDIFLQNLPASAEHRVFISNIQSLIDQQQKISAAGVGNDTTANYHAHYHTYDEIITFLKNISDTYPDLVQLFSIGKTYEGRDIWGITIKSKKAREPTKLWMKIKDYFITPSNSTNGKKKKEMELIMHGGQHAREWISVATITYFIDTLCSKYGQDKHITKDRMWRKNRQPTSFPFCTGIDLNRNWGYEWNRGGSSPNPCSEAYMGPAAFAAVETKLMADFVASRQHAMMYIDFHSYSQLWMSPFGSDCNERPKDEEDLTELSLGATRALKAVHGTSFAAGPVCKIIYQASGGSLDWTYAVANVKYSFAAELRDVGQYGFLLPENQIVPSGEETLAAVLFAAQFINERENGNKGH